MSKRKLWSLLLMSPIIVFIISCLVVISLSITLPQLKINNVFGLIIVAWLVVLSILVWRPLWIVKILNSNSKWTFSIWDINRFSRGEAKKKFWMFFLFALTYLVVNIVLWEILDPNSKNLTVARIGGLISLLVSTVFWVGVTNISLIVVSWGKLKYLDLFNKLKYFFNFLWAYVLYILMVVGWSILFIVPGIYRAIRFSFYPYLIIEKWYNPIKALKESRKITKGKFRDIFSYTLLFGFVNLLWALCLLVGLLWTVPMTKIAQAKMYKELSE